MFRLLATTLISFIFLISGAVSASESRPKIGLVLSGGGARGAAHVGVLKVMEELRIPVDYIAGTSMGSIVAGLYASGMTPEEISDSLTGMDWDAALQDHLDRQEDSVFRKRESDRFSIPISPGYRDGELHFPAAAIQGQNVILALQRFTDHVAHIKDFDDLVIPFRAVATDIITGRKVVLDSGDLATAMRASMAVPSLFAAVPRGDYLLVDGGISDNIPVDIAREMGADVVIVVDISTPLRSKDEIGNLLTITDQLTRLMTQKNGVAQLATLTERDLLIVPELGDITSSAFNRADEAIVIGENTARAQIPELRAFAVSEAEYARYLAARPEIPARDRTILGISIAHNTAYEASTLEQNVDLEVGDQLDLDQLEQNLSAIYGLGHFQQVGYELMQQPDGTDVNITAIRRAVGPNYLHFGLRTEGYSDGDVSLDAVVGYTKTELNSKGGEWTALMALGNNLSLETYLYQPFSRNLNFFIFPIVRVSQDKFSLYEDDNRIAEYKIKSASASVAIGYEFGTRAAATIGLEYTTNSSEIQVGDPTLLEPNWNLGEARLRYRYDTLDDIDFPGNGSLIRFEFTDARDELGSDLDFRQWSTTVGTVKTWQDYTLILSMQAGGTDGSDGELTRPFRLGGFGRLTGLKPDQLFGRQMGLVQTFLYRRFDQIKFLPAFVGGIVEYGGAWQDWDDANKDTAILSGSAFIAVDSPIGPAQLAIGFTDEGDTTAFFRIGRLF